MKLNHDIYKDKVYACWIGKNIGGTLGGPYEGRREKLDVKGFKTKPNDPLPNDDLDLQLIWLQAIEQEGPRNLTAEKLGEYWLSFIVACWSEYGIAKRNMQIGVIPPLCGDMENNVWKHSNGAWIRTEIWATLAPACPDIAARYAIEDAKVDHGMGEGTYAAMFVAAIESAAFVISDIRKLIEIGLAKIPVDCRMARSIRLLLECYDSGVPAMEARDRILAENADISDGWFQAPSNVSYAMLGILYGEGDFKKSMLLAINCGDDTDCTAGTVGSILGIMYGTAGIPTDWREYVGDKIVTLSINLCISWKKITSCTQLTDRVVRLAPFVLQLSKADFRKEVELTDGENEWEDEEVESFLLPYGKSEESDEMRRSVFSLKPHTTTTRFAYATAIVSYDGEPVLKRGGEKKVTVQFVNNVKAYGNQPYSLSVQLVLPEGVSADKKEFEVYLPHWTSVTLCDCLSVPVEITFKAEEKLRGVNKAYLLVSAEGRYTVGCVPVVLLNRE
ncbi:MAG: ADP-ribosylglycohydrolase family protein [Clostridia bacterium]|nr:ADP-ribosylglycohydrolase family protein [Clostridia bacterium]